MVLVRKCCNELHNNQAQYIYSTRTKMFLFVNKGRRKKEGNETEPMLTVITNIVLFFFPHVCVFINGVSVQPLIHNIGIYDFKRYFKFILVVQSTYTCLFFLLFPCILCCPLHKYISTYHILLIFLTLPIVGSTTASFKDMVYCTREHCQPNSRCFGRGPAIDAFGLGNSFPNSQTKHGSLLLLD